MYFFTSSLPSSVFLFRYNTNSRCVCWQLTLFWSVLMPFIFYALVSIVCSDFNSDILPCFVYTASFMLLSYCVLVVCIGVLKRDTHILSRGEQVECLIIIDQCGFYPESLVSRAWRKFHFMTSCGLTVIGRRWLKGTCLLLFFFHLKGYLSCMCHLC